MEITLASPQIMRLRICINEERLCFICIMEDWDWKKSGTEFCEVNGVKTGESFKLEPIKEEGLLLQSLKFFKYFSICSIYSLCNVSCKAFKELGMKKK